MSAKLEIFWGSGSPNAWWVLLAAELKQIPYESRLMEFSQDDHKKPEFFVLNPRAKVPAIRDGDYTLYESLAIMTYLDRRNPEPAIFGRNPADAGRIWRAISEFECYLRQPFDDVLRPILFKQLPEKRTRSRPPAKPCARNWDDLSNPWIPTPGCAVARCPRPTWQCIHS